MQSRETCARFIARVPRSKARADSAPRSRAMNHRATMSETLVEDTYKAERGADKETNEEGTNGYRRFGQKGRGEKEG